MLFFLAYRLACVINSGLCNTSAFEIPAARTYADSVSVTERYRDKMALEDFTTSCVTINHTEYRENCVIIVDVHNENILEVGLIKKIVILGGVPYFWVTRAIAKRNKYREFSVEDDDGQILVHYTALKSYKPLSMQGYEESYTFSLYGAVFNSD